MSIIIFIAICFILICFPYVRIVAFNFPKWFYLTLKDFFITLKNRSFNVCPTGKIICFSGLFGFGKTLSSVHHIISLYNRYNGKKCVINGSLRTQKIIVLSNVHLSTIPYIKFESLSQVTQFTKDKQTLDK